MSFKVARAPDAAADGAWHIVHYSGKIRARDIHSCVHIVPGATYYVSVARTPAIGSTPPPVTLSAYCSQACRLQVSEDPNVRRQLRHASARDGLRLMPEKVGEWACGRGCMCVLGYVLILTEPIDAPTHVIRRGSSTRSRSRPSQTVVRLDCRLDVNRVV